MVVGNADTLGTFVGLNATLGVYDGYADTGGVVEGLTDGLGIVGVLLDCDVGVGTSPKLEGSGVGTLHAYGVGLFDDTGAEDGMSVGGP